MIGTGERAVESEVLLHYARPASDGGKAIIDGPNNYMGALYRSVPVGITVEGANILTRSLMVFGQGAIRAHPYMLKEILALGEADAEKGLDQFDQAFWSHVGVWKLGS